MDIDTALQWAGQRRHGVLITLRSDGRAQSSDVLYALREDGTALISVTDDRAKTANMRRDPRVVLHVSDPDTWSYVALDGTVELSAVAADPHDPTVDALVEYYRTANGEHDDWEDYRRAMVADGRLVVTFRPRSAVGQVNG